MGLDLAAMPEAENNFRVWTMDVDRLKNTALCKIGCLKAILTGLWSWKKGCFFGVIFDKYARLVVNF
jgi:hypothetical protein